MKQQFLPTAMPNSTLPVIDSSDDIDVAIVKLMSNFRGYTLDEVYKQLAPIVADPDAIRPTMLALHTQGWFDSQEFRAAGVTVYTLRKGHTVEMLADDVKRPTKIRKFKQPEVVQAKPEGKIVRSDGIDVAVWKAMQDRNWRSIKDIIAVLVEFGFDRHEVDRRLMALVRTNRWFDRTGTGRNTTYRLKAKMNCPVQPSKLVTSLFDQTKQQPDAGQPETLHVSVPDHDYLPLKDVPPETVKEAMRDLKIEPSDNLTEAMWKVMADMDEYTANDLALLLGDYGFGLNQISPRMSKYFAAGYFTRRAASGSDKKPIYAYRLNVTEVPEHLRSKKPEPVTTESQPTKETPEMTTESLLKVVTQESAVPAELLAVKIAVKGTEISVSEFATLFKELHAAGFLREARSNPNLTTLIEASYTIKGIQFTRSELIELVDKMRTVATNFQNAIRI